MPVLQGWSNTDFSRAAYSTTARHLSTVENNAMRNFPFLALIEASDRIESNCSGRGMDWRVKYRNHDVEGNRGEGPRNFVRKNLRTMAYLQYRGYQVTDIIYRKEMKENRGPEALVKIMENFRSDLQDSLQQQLGRACFIDGEATGNEDTWHGFDSMYGILAAKTLAAAGTGSQNRSQADVLAVPDDTYAGIDTDLQALGGEQESGVMWPLGVADPEYDAWSPMVLIHDSTYFNTAIGGSPTAGQILEEVIRFGIINAARNATLDQQITQVLLDRSIYQTLVRQFAGRERLVVNKGDNPVALGSLGFKNVLNFDGVEVTWDAAVPSNRGYGFNINGIDLKSMNEGLFELDDVEFDIEDQGFRVALSTLSNLRFKSGPRNTFKLIPYSATA